MQDSKPWYQSTTLQGATIAAVPTLVFIFKFFGVDIADLSSDLTKAVVGIIGTAGLVMTIIGRCKATSTLTTTTKIAIVSLSILSLGLGGCAQHDPVVVENSPAAVVGEDLVAAAKRATDAFAAYQNGNVDYAWAVAFMLNAYRDYVKDAADVRALVQAWTAGKGKSLGDRLASLFNSASGSPSEKMTALAHAAELTAESASP